MSAASEKAATPPARVALVVARARNGVIGREGGLPWRLRDDLRHFKRVTWGKPLIMGRKTWESLPGPLPGRPHLVVTRRKGLALEGAETFETFFAALDRAREIASASGVDEVAVIGGGEIFRLALPAADRIYLTEVDAEVPGDAYFPQLDEAGWRERERCRHEADTENDHAFTIRLLDRVET